MNWASLKVGDVLVSRRSQRVYVVLTPPEPRQLARATVEVGLFDVLNGKHVTAHKGVAEAVNPWHYELIAKEGK